VNGKEREHMVKEAATCVYFVLALAVHGKGKLYIGFCRFSFNFRHTNAPL
jgi:hypothetical protein